jgi:hypothetical protein
MQDVISSAAAIISKYNAELARCFLSQPFRRVEIAMAFSKGFEKSMGGDIHPAASLVLRVAYADRDMRVAA